MTRAQLLQRAPRLAGDGTPQRLPTRPLAQDADLTRDRHERSGTREPTRRRHAYVDRDCSYPDHAHLVGNTELKREAGRPGGPFKERICAPRDAVHSPFVRVRLNPVDYGAGPAADLVWPNWVWPQNGRDWRWPTCTQSPTCVQLTSSEGAGRSPRIRCRSNSCTYIYLVELWPARKKQRCHARSQRNCR